MARSATLRAEAVRFQKPFFALLGDKFDAYRLQVTWVTFCRSP